MLKIVITEDTIASQFQKTLESLKIDGFIRIVNEEEATLKIVICRSEDQIKVKCTELDFHEAVSKEEDAVISVLKCCGYSCIKLTGMSVRDSNKVKIKPVIDIFVKSSHPYEFPDTLEFSKGSSPGNDDTFALEEIYFDSEILQSILDTTNLFFKSEEKVFEIALDKKQYFIKHKKSSPVPCMDFLFDTSINESFMKHHEIAKKYPVLNNFIDNKPENLVFNKNFFKKICNNEKDLRDLMDFVEHAPKFQDSRDESIDELKEFLVENYPSSNGHKYEYLEVFKQSVPKNKNKHTLKKFLGL